MIGWFLILSLVGAPENEKTITAIRTETPPGIDGFIEPVWAGSDSAKNFIQNWPEEGKPASESTTVYLLCDNENLYVAFRCYDEPTKIKAWITLRDEGWGDDVSLVLAPFGDQATGYRFVVNARSVQSDMLLTNDARDSDSDWDGVWQSAAKITDFGYVVEMKIHFKSIRFRPGLSEWGINFKRTITRNNESSWWAAVKRDEGLRLSKAGRLVGIEPMTKGLNLEAYPVGLLRYEKQPPEEPAISPEGGLDINWYPSGATALQLTTNPDFAQIEADPYQINLSKYELYLSERRPFFTEGADIFKPATGVDLFYSRRIGKRLADGQEVPILEGTKLTTRFERFNVGLLGAVTGRVEYTDWAGNQLAEPLSYYSVVRIKRNIFKNSDVGILYAGKDNAVEYNRVVGMDGAFRTSNLELKLGGARSARTDSTRGYAGRLEFSWQGKNFYLWTGGSNVGERFDVSQIGYVPRSGYESYYLNPGYQFYQTGIFQYCSINGLAGLSKESGDPGYGYNCGVNLSPQFKNNWGVGFNLDGGRTYEQSRWFNFFDVSFWSWTDWTKPVAMSVSGWWVDRTPYYSSGIFSHFAPQANLNSHVVFKPSPSLSFEVEVNSTVEFDTTNRVERLDWIFRPRLGYALTKDIYLRLYAEPNLVTQIHNINVLLAWNFRPKSWLYFALNESRDNRTGDERLQSRIVVLKAKYLFFL